MIDLSGQPPRDVWRTLLDLADAEPEGWVLIGAQMVALHGIERNHALMSAMWQSRTGRAATLLLPLDLRARIN